jgi:aryl-alcohol dehydrogenase-like predicted oxidoreductase
MMQYRSLGHSGIIVPELILGSWLTIGNGISEKEGFSLMDAALDQGINFFDTADVYNKGGAETQIGIWLKTKSRSQVMIATKAFGQMSDSPLDQGLSLRHLMNACKASLERLQTDYIDLYQCHRYDVDTPLEETCFAMSSLISKGWIRYWGVSQWSAVQITNAVRICEKHNWPKPISNQPIYNMLNRSLETEVMTVCETEGLGLITYSPLAQGLLSGKYTSAEVPEGSRAKDPVMGKMFPLKRLTEDNFKIIEQIKQIASDLNVSMSVLCLAWLLRKKPVSGVIFGATKLEQLTENCKASGLIIANDVLEKIESILGNHPKDQYTGNLVGHGIIQKGY